MEKEKNEESIRKVVQKLGMNIEEGTTMLIRLDELLEIDER